MGDMEVIVRPVDRAMRHMLVTVRYGGHLHFPS